MIWVCIRPKCAGSDQLHVISAKKLQVLIIQKVASYLHQSEKQTDNRGQPNIHNSNKSSIKDFRKALLSLIHNIPKWTDLNTRKTLGWMSTAFPGMSHLTYCKSSTIYAVDVKQLILMCMEQSGFDVSFALISILSSSSESLLGSLGCRCQPSYW